MQTVRSYRDKWKDLLDQQGSSFLLTDDRAQQYVPYTDEIRVEVSGPLRATVLVRGELKRHSHRALARFAVRLHFYAGHKLIQANVTCIIQEQLATLAACGSRR
jgi:hypothetical protein